MKTSLRMFVRREGKRGHEEVIAIVDWEGVSQHDMEIMAAHYVTNALAYQLKQEEYSLAESYEVFARDYLHIEVPVPKELKIPAKWKEPPRSKEFSKVRNILDGLSPEEIKILLSM